MLRSLFSAVSGLRSHQTMMDVVGNNIANVNTAGFKSSSTVFEDTLSQVVRAGGGPQGLRGGTNPAQVGPRRARRRHHHQLRPGQHPDDRQGHRRGAAGRRLLRGQAGRTDVVQPRWCVLLRPLGPARQPRRRRRPGLGGHGRPGQHQRPRRSAQAPDRPDRPAPADRQCQRRRQPSRGGGGGHEVLELDRHLRQPGQGRVRDDGLHQDRSGRVEPQRHGARRDRQGRAGGQREPHVGRAATRPSRPPPPPPSARPR